MCRWCGLAEAPLGDDELVLGDECLGGLECLLDLSYRGASGRDPWVFCLW